MEKVSSQLDYSKVLSSHPTYALSRILPLSGSQDTTITAAGGNETIFEIPSKVYNFSRSRLDFTLNIPRSNAGGDNFTYVFKDAIGPIRQMQLYTRAGLYLCDIPYFNNYTKIARKPFTSLKDFLDLDILYSGGSLPGGKNSSVGSFLQRNNLINTEAGNSQATVTNANLKTPSKLNRRHDNSIASISYTEPQYFESSAIDGANANLFFNVSIPFKEIKNCLLALDKDLYFGGEVLILRIVWDSTNKVVFNAVLNGANGGTQPATAPAQYPAAVNLEVKSMTLYMAIEKDPAIVTDIINATATDQGLSVLSDYIFSYKFNIGPTNNPSITLRFNRGHGRKLKFVLAAPFFTETLNTMYDHSNVGISGAAGALTGDGYTYGTKITSFYTLLNNNRLQEFDLVTANGDDYKYLQNHIKDSVLQNGNIYSYNWVWIENFCGEKTIDVHPNLDCGLPLDIEQKWDIYYTCPNIAGVAPTLNHYLFGIVQRLLRINKDGITMI